VWFLTRNDICPVYRNPFAPRNIERIDLNPNDYRRSKMVSILQMFAGLPSFPDA
jgi:hypothetical protein